MSNFINGKNVEDDLPRFEPLNPEDQEGCRFCGKTPRVSNFNTEPSYIACDNSECVLFDIRMEQEDWNAPPPATDRNVRIFNLLHELDAARSQIGTVFPLLSNVKNPKAEEVLDRLGEHFEKYRLQIPDTGRILRKGLLRI